MFNDFNPKLLDDAEFKIATLHGWTGACFGRSSELTASILPGVSTRCLYVDYARPTTAANASA